MGCNGCPWSKHVLEKMTSEEYEQFRDKCKQVLGYRPTEDYQNCLGCQTPDDEIPKGSRTPLRNCLIRRCVDKADMKNCAYCSRFPCSFVETHGTLWAREKIEKKHGKPISEDDYLTFVEPFEGLKHLKKIRDSLSSKDIVEAAIVPPLDTNIMKFPDNLSLSKEKIVAFKNVHKLLTTIKKASLGLTDTDTFA